MHTVMTITKRLADLEKLRQIISEERRAGRDIEPIMLDNGETVYFRFSLNPANVVE